MTLPDPVEASAAIQTYAAQQTDHEVMHRHQGGASKTPQREGKTRAWMSRAQRRFGEITKKKWSSNPSSSNKKRPRSTEKTPGPISSNPNPSPIPPAGLSIVPTPPPSPVDPFIPPFLSPVIAVPIIPLPLTLPPLVILPSTSPASSLYLAVDVGTLPPIGNNSSAALALSDMCFEFLQVDDRPTAILEIRPNTSISNATDKIEVKTLFMNPPFEHLKPQLKLDFEYSNSMGGILKQVDSGIVWVVPNSYWQLRCTNIASVLAAGKEYWWLKVMVVDPVLPPREEVYADLILNKNDTQTPNLSDPTKKTAISEAHLENYGSGGGGDLRRVSIAEETSRDISQSGKPEGGTPFSSKTITPGHTKTTNTARGSTVSSDDNSRRSSRSPPPRKSPNSAPEVKLVKPNMDWTRGAMLRKNTQNIAGMEEHLNFLMHAPWYESPIGPPMTWPISLRCIANVVMSFPHPAMVYWSNELIAIYNPQAKVLAGDNHPQALGKPFAVGFPAFKKYMMPFLQKALEGKTTLRTDEPLFLDIDVPNEECYYNFIISPIIGASGFAEGVLKQAHSRTSQVIQSRRIETLHKIREHVELVRDLDRDDFWKLLLEGLGANEVDSPFALLYKVVSENRCVLASTLGISEEILLENDLVPGKLRVGGKTSSSAGKRTGTGSSSRGDFPLVENGRLSAFNADDSGNMSPVDEEATTASSSSGFDTDDHFLFFHEILLARETNSVVAKDLTKVAHEYKQNLARIKYRGFGDPCTHAVVIPIQPSPSKTFGYLILGLNPRRPFNNEYLMWLNMLMEQLSTSIGRVMLLTEDLRRAVQEARHQKQLAFQALERKRQQENFIDISSHELRNPLSAVLQSAEGIISLIERHQSGRAGSLDIEQIADSTRTILLCVNHQRIIIEDILTVGKLDSNLMTVVPVPSDPRDLIWNGLKMFEAELASKGIDWEFRVLESYDFLEVGWVKVDPSRTTQILVNLVANAIKFTTLKEGKKKISIVLDASSESPTNWSNFDYLPSEKLDDVTEMEEWGTGEPIYLSVAVKDTGIGISTKNKRNLFQRFNQVPKTHITYGGSGLGLYISRRLCQLQGGNIGVASVEGEGSTFRFYVKTRRTTKPETAHTSIGSPRSRRESREMKNLTFHSVTAKTSCDELHTPTDTVSEPPIRKASPDPLYHVLVVEDNLINQKVLRRQLISEGCVVYTANNGKEALETILQSKFVKKDGNPLDIVLMDMEMPVMGGVEATKRIRKFEQEKILLHVPIIGISANARLEQMREMTEAGMDDAIPKPFRIADLLRKFRTII